MRYLFGENRAIFMAVDGPAENPGSSQDSPEQLSGSLSDYGLQIDSEPKSNKEDLKVPEQKEASDQLSIPERPKDALTGTQFGEKLENMESELRKKLREKGKSNAEIREAIMIQREKSAYEEIKKGNIPESLRKLQQVEMKYENDKGETVTAKIKVMPDYLSIGSEEDHIRVPMTPYTAQLIARDWNCTLPTPKMVDAIAKQAKIKLEPVTKPAGPRMTGTTYFIEHNKAIQDQLAKTSYTPGDLIDGNKKDIVIPHKGEGSTHVAIYGWHYPNGDKIQSYYSEHADFYADYSHGTRLIADYVEIEIRDKDGKIVRKETKRATDVMADKYRYFILTDKPIANASMAYAHGRWAEKMGGSREPTSTETSNEQAKQQPAQDNSDQGIPIDLAPKSSGSNQTAPYSPSYAKSSTESVSAYPSYSTPTPTESATPEPAVEQTTEYKPLHSNLPPIVPATSPREYLKLNEPPPPIEERSGFFGDSISFRIDTMPYLKGQGHEDFAKGGKDTEWLNNKVLSSTEEIKKLDNAFVLIGTNDLGYSGRSAKTIFDNTMDICKNIKAANKNIKLHLCTVPPYGGFKKYDRNPAINEKRHALNELIRDEYKKNPGMFRLIDLCLPLEEGGISDRSISEYKDARIHNALKFRDDKHPEREDHLHPYQEILARTIGRAYHAYEAKEHSQTVNAETVQEGFTSAPEFNEQTKTYKYPPNTNDAMTVHINRTEIDPNKETTIVVYGLPAANSIEQTIGSQNAKGENWRYGIQHIGAQVRQLRAAQPEKNIIVAYVQAPNNTLNKWLKENPDKQITANLLQNIKLESGAPNATLDLSSHSAGGELIDHYIRNNQEIPNDIKRITFLDSQNTLDLQAAGPKLIKWLKASKDHHLTIIGYDDREALFKGEPFPGQGSSYASLMSITNYLAKNGLTPPFAINGKLHADTHTSISGMNGQINIKLLHNPGNGHRIRHTETVEYNGFIVGETAGTDNEVAQFQGEKKYEQYIQKDHTRLA